MYGKLCKSVHFFNNFNVCIKIMKILFFVPALSLATKCLNHYAFIWLDYMYGTKLNLVCLRFEVEVTE